MALDLLAAQRTATVVLNASVAVVAACVLSRSWLAGASSAWAAKRGRRLACWCAGTMLLALLADLASLWLKAAEMAEVPPAQAAGAVGTVLSGSHYGVAWIIGAAALLVAGAWLWTARSMSRPGSAGMLAFLPLAVFWYAQCMSSHGAEAGDISVFMFVYSAHLALISLWVGEVLVAGLVVLAGGDATPGSERRAFVQRLSASATRSLAGILLTGAYVSWQMLHSVADLINDPYGRTLLVKLALVAAAAGMGAYNRFVVMPSLGADGAGGDAAALRFRGVLRVEAAVLLGALVLAAILSSTAPPGTGMGESAANLPERVERHINQAALAHDDLGRCCHAVA